RPRARLTSTRATTTRRRRRDRRSQSPAPERQPGRSPRSPSERPAAPLRCAPLGSRHPAPAVAARTGSDRGGGEAGRGRPAGPRQARPDTRRAPFPSPLTATLAAINEAPPAEVVVVWGNRRPSGRRFLFSPLRVQPT